MTGFLSIFHLGTFHFSHLSTPKNHPAGLTENSDSIVPSKLNQDFRRKDPGLCSFSKLQVILVMRFSSKNTDLEVMLIL